MCTSLQHLDARTTRTGPLPLCNTRPENRPGPRTPTDVAPKCRCALWKDRRSGINAQRAQRANSVATLRRDARTTGKMRRCPRASTNGKTRCKVAPPSLSVCPRMAKAKRRTQNLAIPSAQTVNPVGSAQLRDWCARRASATCRRRLPSRHRPATAGRERSTSETNATVSLSLSLSRSRSH